MKKLITTFFCATILVVGISAQELAYDKSYARWSLGVKGGIDYYRVAPYGTNGFKTHLFKWGYNSYFLQASWAAPSLFFEYSINPYFGIGMEVGWLNFNRGTIKDITYEGVTAPAGVYLGSTVDALAVGSVNILNLMAPYRKNGWRKVSLYANFGIGGGFGSHKSPRDTKWEHGGSFIGMAGLALAFNVSKNWELFLEGQYRSYTNERALSKYNFNDRKSADAVIGFFGVRYKLNQRKDVNGHARSLSAPEYDAYMAEDFSGTRARLNDLTDQVNTLRDKTDRIGNDVEDLKKNKADKVDLDALKDRVRSLEEEIKRLKTGESATASFDNVVFETGTVKLTIDSKEVLTNLVNMLKMHKISSIEISGHTDNTGSESYNLKLSEKRAESVKAYLINEGFEGSKITATGYGFKKPIADNSTAYGRAKNRRVEVTVKK
ncbi:MAG: OmpA family protein [Prevotellaceae bacterium]|jgi:outer membrane protein OmpA-like peptidoglycan-associated protein|nr:OmpA family protein [Prevotellaceae bacterium]